MNKHVKRTADNSKKLLSMYAGKFIKRLLTVMAGCICLLGCDFIEDLFGEKDDELSKKEIAQIREDYETIDLTARDFVLQDAIDMDLAAALIEEYRQLESVEDAWLDIDGIVVKFKKYGLALWTYKHEFINPPFFDIDRIDAQVNNIRSQVLASTRAAEVKVLPSNNKIGIFCGLSKDIAGEAFVIRTFERLSRDLGTDYDVHFYPAEDFTINAFKAGLKEFGTIIIATHGGLTGGKINGEWQAIPPRTKAPDQHVWFYTGEKGNIVEKYTEDYQHDRLAYDESIVFNEKLIKDGPGNLPNTLFFTLSCYGMHDNLLGKVMEDKRKGEGVTIGYDDSNSIGHATAWYLFEALLGGYTVKEVYDEFLPLDCKEHPETRENREPYTTYLEYYPKSGGNVSLASEKISGNIIMQNPADGGFYTERVIPLKGTCVGFDENITGTVSVGDLTMPLNFVNKNTFSQDIEIKKGENIIKIVCAGNAENRPVTFIANKELRIMGDVPDIPLYTALQWNTAGTDVDLHLVGPDGVDCYFYNKRPSWGGILDIDDTNGFGPEHITIPVLKQIGIYKLYAHYYATNGRGPSQVWVHVETPAEKIAFGPHTLTATGEKWQVCEITFNALTYPYYPVINYTSLRAGESIGIFENLPAKKEEQ